MPSRGFATAAILIVIALTCLAVVRRLERDGRLTRLALSGAIGALALAVLIAILILRR